MNDATQFFNTSGGYEISRSLRFNSADSAHLSRNFTSAGNRKTWTWSGWVKRSGLGATNTLFFAGTSSTNLDLIRFDSSDRLDILWYFGGVTANIITTPVYRDPSAWKHVVVSVDTTQATASNRIRVYVNGIQITTLTTATYPAQNTDSLTNATNAHNIGRDGGNVNFYLNGYLADVHFIDGQALTPSSFGEFDTNNIWQPKAYSGGTYGTNGFHLDFADNSTAAALGYDAAGSNDWTVNNITAETPKSLPGILLDGDGDYLSFADSASFDLGQSSEPFTIEAWVKPSSQANGTIFGRGGGAAGWNSTNGHQYLFFYFSGNIYFQWWNGSSVVSINGSSLTTNAWAHLAAVYDGSVLKIYKNGSQILSSASPTFALPTTRNLTRCGTNPSSDNYWNGIVSNLRIVKGTAVYTGAFTPSTSLTNITNTVLLCCKSSDSATASVVTPSTITSVGNTFASTFTDSSGANDSLVDSPTNYGTDTGAGSEVRGNYATLNPLTANSVYTITNGNLDVSDSGAIAPVVLGTIAVNSGKWYWEVTLGNQYAYVGAAQVTSRSSASYLGVTTGQFVYNPAAPSSSWINGTLYNYSTASTATAGDVIGVALDFDSNTITFYKNGVSQGTFGSSVLGTSTWAPAFKSNVSTSAVFNFGQRPFAYTAPSGFKALCTQNLPAPTITKPSTVMDVLTWTGADSGTTRSFTGLNFSPDLVWTKSRNKQYEHLLYDSIGGTGTASLTTSSAGLQGAALPGTYGYLSSFNSQGFTFTRGSAGSGANPDGYAYYDELNATYVAWSFDAGSSTVTNTSGSISAQVRANPTAGFSIVSYTGSGVNATIGHGLNVAPDLVIVKRRDATANWQVRHRSLAASNTMSINQNGAASSEPTVWNSTNPTSSVFSVGTNGDTNATGGNYTAYVFSPVSSYSAFGSYVGNGSTDGVFCYTHMRPRWIMIKASSTTGNWIIFDANRNGANVDNDHLWANSSTDELNLDFIDIVSNGFKLRTSGTVNAASVTYIYAAFAESPFALARAR